MASASILRNRLITSLKVASEKKRGRDVMGSLIKKNGLGNKLKGNVEETGPKV